MSAQVSQEKSKLRKELMQKRDAFPSKERQRWDQAIVRSLESFATEHQSQHIFIFYGYKSEPKVQIWAQMDAARSLKFYLPIIDSDGTMQFARWKNGDSMTTNKYGISEPTGKTLSQTEVQNLTNLLIVVPALAVDSQGFRLGYGGGYYDRFLAQHENAMAIAVTYSGLCNVTVPRESFDMPVRACITQSGIRKI